MGYKRHKLVQEFSSNNNLARDRKLRDVESTMDSDGIDNKDEIREKTIRVRKRNYDELREIGKMGIDFDDVITKLLEVYKKEQHKRKS
jgi:hypothetical protein